MKRTLTRLLCVLLLGASSPAWLVTTSAAQGGNAARATSGTASNIQVRVVDIAGGHLYVMPGQSAGLQRGDEVVLGKQRYTVSAVSDASAVLDGPTRGVKLGSTGRASVRLRTESDAKSLPKPEPLSAFEGQWPRVRLPASTQPRRSVPLGPVATDSRGQALLTMSGAGVIPLQGDGQSFARGELRGRVHYEPIRELPLRLDADAAAQLWFASGLDDRTRPPARVRELQLAYGNQSAFFGALGRLRYASRTLGMLDGARVQTPLVGGLSLGAFGGIVPDPLNGAPSTDASRFGASVGYEDTSVALRPRVVLDAHASRFDGKLDERRLTAHVDVFPGDSRASVYGEVSAFDADNPWNAPQVQITAAGADSSLRFGMVELGARVDMQQRERSRWLASYLPQGFLCTSASANPSTPGEPCHGNDARYLGTADVALHFSRVMLTLGGQASRTEHVDAEQLGGFLAVTVLQLVEQVRFDGSLTTSTGSVMDSAALSLALGSPLLRDTLDVSLRYRPSVNQYLVDTSYFVEHTVGAGVLWHATSELDFNVDGNAIAGRDVSAVLVQGLLAWRPTF